MSATETSTKLTIGGQENTLKQQTSNTSQGQGVSEFLVPSASLRDRENISTPEQTNCEKYNIRVISHKDLASGDASSSSNNDENEYNEFLAQRVDPTSREILNRFAQNYIKNNSISLQGIKDLENIIHLYIVQTHSNQFEFTEHENPEKYVAAIKFDYIEYLEQQCKNLSAQEGKGFNAQDFHEEISKPFFSLRSPENLQEYAELATQIRQYIYKNAFPNSTLQGTFYVEPITEKTYRVSHTFKDILKIFDANIHKCRTREDYYTIFQAISTKCQKKIDGIAKQKPSENKTLFERKDHSSDYKFVCNIICVCTPYSKHQQEKAAAEASGSHSFKSRR